VSFKGLTPSRRDVHYVQAVCKIMNNRPQKLASLNDCAQRRREGCCQHSCVYFQMRDAEYRLAVVILCKYISLFNEVVRYVER
jgi:hypothetical protein